MIKQQAQRTCPICRAPDPIAEDQALWPVGWSCADCAAELKVEDGIVVLAPALDGTIDGFDPASFATLARAEEGHFWFASRNTLIAWAAKRYAPQAHRLLEVGCGSGFVLGALRNSLPQARIAGSELHSAGLAFARERYQTQIELIQMDARDIGLHDVLDVACAFDVLEHIEADEAVIANMAAALVPGGVLLATVPQHPSLWSAADDYAEHKRRYKRGELSRKLEAAGLEVLHEDSFMSLPLPLMMLSRLMERLRPADTTRPDALIAREFDVSAPINGGLKLLLGVEHVLRRIGVRFPVGGSQVLVARKPLS